MKVRRKHYQFQDRVLRKRKILRGKLPIGDTKIKYVQKYLVNVIKTSVNETPKSEFTMEKR